PYAPEMPEVTAGQESIGASPLVVPLPNVAQEHLAEKVVAAERVMATSSETHNAPLHSLALPCQQPAVANEFTSVEGPPQSRMDDQTPALAQELRSEYAAGREEAQ